MALKIHPIKIKESNYLLMPKSITKMLDIDTAITFHLRVEKTGAGFSLLYEKEG